MTRPDPHAELLHMALRIPHLERSAEGLAFLDAYQEMMPMPEKPDKNTELAAIRQDIQYLAWIAARHKDVKALKQLQATLIRWIQKQDQDNED